MSEELGAGLQNTGTLVQPKIGACPSLSYAGSATKIGACPSFSSAKINGGDSLSHQQTSIAARSYSDIGPFSLVKATQRIEEGANRGNKINMSATDLVFYHQYNSVYGVTEVEGGAPGYFPCSYGQEGLRGGAGSWSFRLDPEVRRKSRLAGYRAISFEGKMRSSVKKSFRWIKHKCISLLPGSRSANSSATPSHAAISTDPV